jgi:hypothetical protein
MGAADAVSELVDKVAGAAATASHAEAGGADVVVMADAVEVAPADD